MKTKHLALLISGLSTLAYADIPQQLKFCNLSPFEAQVKVTGRTNAEIEVDGGHGPNTKLDIAMNSGECKVMNVHYENKLPCHDSHSEISLQISEHKGDKWEPAEKFNINSDPGNIDYCSANENSWTPRSYSKQNNSDLHIMFPAIEGIYYNDNYSNFTKLGSNTVFDIYKHNGGRDKFTPYPNKNEQVFYIYSKRLNNPPAQQIRNVVDLNFNEALKQVRSKNKSSFFYQLMGLTNKAKFTSETTNQIHNNQRFELNKICDINYQVNPSIDVKTELASPVSNDGTVTLKRELVNEFKSGEARTELTAPWSFSEETSETATTTYVSSNQLGFKFKQSGGFKLVASGEMTFEANFKMVEEVGKSEYNKTNVKISVPSMQIHVPKSKDIYVTYTIQQSKFSGTFVNRYPVTNVFATAIINKNMNASCNDANYMINVSDLLKFKEIKNTSIFNQSESNDTVYVEDKFKFTTNNGYSILVQVWDKKPEDSYSNKLRLAKSDEQSHLLTSKVVSLSELQKNTPIIINSTSNLIKKDNKAAQINPFTNTK